MSERILRIKSVPLFLLKIRLTGNYESLRKYDYRESYYPLLMLLYFPGALGCKNVPKHSGNT